MTRDQYNAAIRDMIRKSFRTDTFFLRLARADRDEARIRMIERDVVKKAFLGGRALA